MTKEDFIKKLVLNKWGSMKKFSEVSGVPYTTLVTIFKNSINRASVENVIKIAKGLGKSVEDLEVMYALTQYQESSAEASILRDSEEIYTAIPNLETMLIPYYGDIAAGALAIVNPVLEGEVKFMPIPMNFLGRQTTDELISFRVNGESMNNVIPHGSTVVAKKVYFENVKDEDIVIFSFDGQYSMKRVRRDEQDKVLIFSPESTNKKFRDTVIPYNTEGDLKIYAKVIWYGVTL